MPSEKGCEYGRGTRYGLGIALALCGLSVGGWALIIRAEMGQAKDTAVSAHAKVEVIEEQIAVAREALGRIDERLTAISDSTKRIEKSVEDQRAALDRHTLAAKAPP